MVGTATANPALTRAAYTPPQLRTAPAHRVHAPAMPGDRDKAE
jgi:hypothetical protein